MTTRLESTWLQHWTQAIAATVQGNFRAFLVVLCGLLAGGHLGRGLALGRLRPFRLGHLGLADGWTSSKR